VTLYSFFDIINNDTGFIPKVDFVTYLGDTPSHNIYEQKQEEHLRSFKYMCEGVNRTRKNVGDAYVVFGNHDAYPADQFDANDIEHNGGAHKWLLNYTSDMLKQWFTKESYENFRSWARYSQLHPGTKLRIIGLNTFVYLNTNKYLFGNSSDPMGIVIQYNKVYS
jgi:hypothetical protein